MRKFTRISLLGLVLFASLAQSQVYNFFPPPGITYTPGTGMTLGSATGGAQGAGTVNATGLFVNGTAVSTGTVTSVALTTPSWLTVTGSPITTSGTLAVTATGAQTADEFLATPCGSNGAVALRILCATDLPSSGVTAGSYTAPSITVDVTGRITAATTHTYATSVGFSDGSTTPIFNITGSPVTSSGTLTETLKTQSANTFLSGPSLGSATQPAFRPMVPADLPLSSNITWTGQNTFTPASGAGVTVNGTAASDSMDVNNGTSQFMKVTGNNGTGTSDGLDVVAGTNSSDTALLVTSRAATQYFKILGDGGILAGTPTGGDKGVGTINATALYVAGSAVPSLGGGGNFTTGPTIQGFAIPLVSYALISISGSTCSVSGTQQSQNIASCVYNSAGDYTINFTAAYHTTGPNCTALSTGSSSPKVLTTESNSTSLVEFGSFLSTSGAHTDGNFTLMCFGT